MQHRLCKKTYLSLTSMGAGAAVSFLLIVGVGAPHDSSSNSTFGNSTFTSGGNFAFAFCEYFFVTATWSASGLIEDTERFKSACKRVQVFANLVTNIDENKRLHVKIV